jgi:gliding motility-associated-like protein
VTDRAEAFPTKTAIIYQMKIENIVDIWFPRILLSLSISALISANCLSQLIVTPSANPASLCAGASVQLNVVVTGGSGTYGYVWSSSTSTFTSTLVNPVDIPTANTIYTVDVTDLITPSTTGTGQTGVIVNPPPVPTFTVQPGASTCGGVSVTYTTETGGGITNYVWVVPGASGTDYNIIAGGIGGASNTVTLQWLTTGSKTVTVNYTNAGGCVGVSAASNSTTVNGLPVTSFTVQPGANTCVGVSVTYTTETGGGITNYVWVVPGASGTDYNITAGGIGDASNTVTLQWLTTGSKTVTVNYTNASGCVGASAASNSTTVDAPPVPSFTTQPGANTCVGVSVMYTTQTGGGITNYVWVVPGASGTDYNITAGGIGGASNTVTLQWLTTGSKTVTVNYTNAGGCVGASAASNSTTVNATPIPTISSSDADNIFCAGTSVTFTASGGSNYNFRIGVTTVQNGTSATYTTASLTNGQVVDVVVSNPGGCAATSTGITNTVTPQPNANAGTGGNVCGLAFKLTAVPSVGTGTWTKTAGPGTATFSPNNNTAGATVTVSDYGLYTFAWTEVNGQCTSSSVVSATFLLQPIADAGTGGNVCGLGFHLNGTMNTGTGTWAKVSGPGNVSFSPNATTANALVTVTAFGTYTFSWTVTNGICSNGANVIVAFIQEISASGGSGGDVCGKSFTLNAMAPPNGIGTWSKYRGTGNATFASDNHQTAAIVTVDQYGIYDFAWTVVSGTCSSSDIIRVVFHDKPFINAGRDTAMCKGGNVQLKAAGIGTVSWTPVQLLSNPGIINPIATPDTTTKFIVNLTDQFGCKNSDTIVVEVRNKVIANAGPDQMLNFSFTTQLAAKLNYNYEKGIWSVISGTGVFRDNTSATTIVDGLSKGTNTLLWTVTNGYCPLSRDSTNITVQDFVIPTLITPNMDGRNDYFIIGGLTADKKTELLIFDRRGVQVYKNLNYDNSWNGVDYNNKPLADDTYFYVIKYADGKSYRGYLVIRR